MYQLNTGRKIDQSLCGEEKTSQVKCGKNPQVKCEVLQGVKKMEDQSYLICSLLFSLDEKVDIAEKKKAFVIKRS